METSFAACQNKNQKSTRIMSPNIELWKVVTKSMQECGSVEANLNSNFKEELLESLTSSPSQYHLIGANNLTLVPLIEAELIMPLDWLIKKNNILLEENQKVIFDGKIMAIAIAAETQNFMFRQDIFKTLDIPEPQSYEDVISAAKILKKSGMTEYPLGGAYQKGWHLGHEFISIYIGFNGKFFDEQKNPKLNSQIGLKTLRLMKKLSSFMSPNFLSFGPKHVQRQLQQGQIAMANLWSSRSFMVNDRSQSKTAGKIKMISAPSSGNGTKPAASLWWDGIVIARNISEEDAEIAFKVLLKGIDKKMVSENSNVAVWLIDGYMPSQNEIGAFETIKNGAIHYPISESMILIHKSLSNGIAAYLLGTKNEVEALTHIENTLRISLIKNRALN